MNETDTKQPDLKEVLSTAIRALEQYLQGDEHAEKDELVAAAAHYEEGDRLRKIVLGR